MQESGKPLSIFVFASIRAISQFTVTQILEMGIDGFWIGYEGTRSGYAKQSGRPVEELFREFREHGISILASMIVGLPYQTPEIIEEELSGLLALEPSLNQFLIYGPTPGTPFYERIMKEGLMHRELTADPERYYRKSTGFSSMVKHPTMRPEEIESAQARCFSEDFRTLGPSIYRSIEAWLLGYLKLKDSPNPRVAQEGSVLRVGDPQDLSCLSRRQAAGAVIQGPKMDGRPPGADPSYVGSAYVRPNVFCRSAPSAWRPGRASCSSSACSSTHG